MTDHEHPIELLGVYAVDALDPDERLGIEAHLRSCPHCRDEVDAHRSALAQLSGEEAPPAEVWERISAQLGETEGASMPIATVQPIRPRPRVRQWLAASVAAAAVLAVAVGVTAMVTSDGDGDDLAELAQAALAEPGTTLVSLAGDEGGEVARVAVGSDGRAYLLLDELPTLPEGRAYQLWRLGDDDPVSLGVLGDGSTPVVALTVPRGSEQLAITIEPARGVVQPTGRIVASGAVQA